MLWLLFLPFCVHAFCDSDNGTVPRFGLISREIVMQAQPVRGVVTLIDICTFSVSYLEIDSGVTPIWMGANDTLSSSSRTALTTILNTSDYLSSTGFFIPQSFFSISSSIDNFQMLLLVDSTTNTLLGSVNLATSTAGLPPLPTSLPKCFQLAPNYRVRWNQSDTEIDFSIEGVGTPMTWMAFGPAAPGVTNRLMGGADTTFTTVSPPQVVDSYLSSYLECYHGTGACADIDTLAGLNAQKGPGKSDSQLIYTQSLNNINFARFRRLLDTQDVGFDHVIVPNSSQFFVWGAGNFMNSSSGVKYLTHGIDEDVSYGSLGLFLGRDIYNCKPFPIQPNTSSIIALMNTSADQFESKFLGGAQANLADSDVTLFWKLDDVAQVVKFGVRRTQQSGYLALGVGTIMSGAKTWVAVQGQEELFIYQMGGQTANSLVKLDEPISGYAWYSQNNIFSFEFARPYGDMDVNSNIPFLWAIGNTWTSSSPQENDYHTQRSNEPTYINLRSGQITTGPGNKYLVVHGVFMALAWGVCVPLAVALMRAAKIINKPKYALYHPWLNAFAAVLSFIGVIVVVVMLYNNQAKHLFSEHAKLGLATLVFFMIQLLIGLLRPSLGRVSVNGGGKGEERKISMEQVAQHTTEQSCWLVVRDRVYDVTPFLDTHPGGKKVLLSNSGKDATETFEKIHPSPDTILKEYTRLCIGVLASSPSYSPPTSTTIAATTQEQEMTQLQPASSSASTSEQQQQQHTYTMQEVSTHNNADSCWLVVRGNVYDLTQWLDRHPGGRELLLENAGKDATELFEKNHEEADKILQKKAQLCIGAVSTVSTVTTAITKPEAVSRHDSIIPVATTAVVASSLHSESQKQRIWFWTHSLLGMLTLCLSWATIYYGLELMPTRGFPNTYEFAGLACAWFVILTLFIGYFVFLHKWAIPRMDKKCGQYLAAAGCAMLVIVALVLSIIAGVSANPDEASAPAAMMQAQVAKPIQIITCSGVLSGCPVVNCALIGDGWCDAYAPYNTPECNYDGGDCCKDASGMEGGLFRCLDPSSPRFNTSSPTGFSNVTYTNVRYGINSNGQVRKDTDENFASTYNNFYEFGFDKSIYPAALAQTSLFEAPWEITIDGLVETPLKMNVSDLIDLMHLEERNYRHRCVEAWSVVIPWLGFPLYGLLDLVKPLPTATYVKFTAFNKPFFPGGLPWPYVEGLTIDEAKNELAFISVGSYGTKLKPQSGAPIRLTIPWKYGFKSIKSIVHIELTNTRPDVFWNEINSNEYGFWSNVNPQVPHPRWSQAAERALGGSATDSIIPTQLFNGYAELVSYLYNQYQNTGELLYK